METHLGICRNGTGNKCISAYYRIFADHRLAAKDRRSGIDRHIVFNRWMTFFSGQFLTAACRKTTQRNSLIQFYMVADDRRLPDDDAGSVVDKETLADLRTGVNILRMYNSWAMRYTNIAKSPG